VADETYEDLKEAYLAESEEFTELNKEYNRAVRLDELTDELELRFLKAERSLHESYRVMQVAKMEENN
jgi:hypothetical protein